MRGNYADRAVGGKFPCVATSRVSSQARIYEGVLVGVRNFAIVYAVRIGGNVFAWCARLGGCMLVCDSGFAVLVCATKVSDSVHT